MTMTNEEILSEMDPLSRTVWEALIFAFKYDGMELTLRSEKA
jgi:hypothetical protein